jgi:hypothetical protein
MVDGCRSTVMARLTLSAVADATRHKEAWQHPEVHRALLISGLSVLTAATWLLRRDLNGEVLPPQQS